MTTTPTGKRPAAKEANGATPHHDDSPKNEHKNGLEDKQLTQHQDDDDDDDDDDVVVVVQEPATVPSPRNKRRKSETERNDTTADADDDYNCIAIPLYASKEYWENRYREQFQKEDACAACAASDDDINHDEHKESNGASGVGNGDDKKKTASSVRDNNDTTIPYHAWYFTYSELRPLLLPLILGSTAIDQDDELQEERDEEAASSNGGEGEVGVLMSDSRRNGESPLPKNTPVVTTNAASTDNGRGDDDDGDDAADAQQEKNQDISKVEDGDDEEENNDDGDDEEDQDDEEDEYKEEEEEVERHGLANHGRPISIIEIGCGDVPLGADLAREIKSIQDEKTGSPVRDVVQSIICIDYSEIVVETMKKKYLMSSALLPSSSSSIGAAVADPETSTTTPNPVPSESTATSTMSPNDCINVENYAALLDFQVADARNLPYPNESFDLILEKGTLDAMLSGNTQQGIDNCALIVSECARVLKTNGYFVIISHLNAHTPEGLDWLQNVVFQGIQQHQEQQSANSSNDDDDDDDDEQTTAASWEVEVHGNDPAEADEGTACPAVYIIHKMPGTTITTTVTSANTTTDEGAVLTMEEAEDEEMPTIPVKFFSY